MTLAAQVRDRKYECVTSEQVICGFSYTFVNGLIQLVYKFLQPWDYITPSF